MRYAEQINRIDTIHSHQRSLQSIFLKFVKMILYSTILLLLYVSGECMVLLKVLRIVFSVDRN